MKFPASVGEHCAAGSISPVPPSISHTIPVSQGSQSISRWKRPISIPKSSSLLLTGSPKAKSGWECCPDAPWGLVLWPLPSGAWSSAWSAPGWRSFPCCPVWASLAVASLHFLLSCHRGDIVPMPPWGAEQRDQSPPWCSVIMRVNIVLCPFWCPFKCSKKDKNLQSISDLAESLSE